jgi:hypothetical protein
MQHFIRTPSYNFPCNCIGLSFGLDEDPWILCCSSGYFWDDYVNHLEVALFFKASFVVSIALDRGSKIIMPTIHQVKNFKEVIQAKYPSLVHCWGALDGVKIGIQQPSDDMKQSYFYYGWTHDHYVANIFLFTPDG